MLFVNRNCDFCVQLVVSDYGMIEGGNYGGVLYQEVDVLVLFILESDFINMFMDKR